MDIAALLTFSGNAVPARPRPGPGVERRRPAPSSLNRVASLLNPAENEAVLHHTRRQSAPVNVNMNRIAALLNPSQDAVLPRQAEPQPVTGRRQSDPHDLNNVASLLNPEQCSQAVLHAERPLLALRESNRIATLLNPSKDEVVWRPAEDSTAPSRTNQITTTTTTTTLSVLSELASAVLDRVEIAPESQLERQQPRPTVEHAQDDVRLSQTRVEQPRIVIEQPQSEADHSQAGGMQSLAATEQCPRTIDTQLPVDAQLEAAQYQSEAEQSQSEASSPATALSGSERDYTPVPSFFPSPYPSPSPSLSPTPTPALLHKHPVLTTEDVIVRAACKRMTERNRWPKEIQRVWKEHGSKSDVYAKYKLAWVALQIMRHKANNRRGFAGQSELRRICGHLPTLTREEQKRIVVRINRELLKHPEVVSRVNRAFKRRKGYSGDEDITGEDLVVGITSLRFAKISPKPTPQE